VAHTLQWNSTNLNSLVASPLRYIRSRQLPQLPHQDQRGFLVPNHYYLLKSRSLECTSKITAKAGQTTNQIAKSNSVSTDRLLTWNVNLPTNINDTLTRDEVVCLDNVQKCLLHQVAAEDTCNALVKISGKGVTDVMFQSWNPSVGPDCRNLPAMIGKYICVSPSGQDTPFTPIEGTPKPTITTTATPESTYSWGQVSNSPTSSTKNFTTTWLFPTDAVSLSTRTASMLSPAEATAIKARTSHCPFLDEGDDDWQDGLASDEYHLHSWELAEDCTDKWDPYCNPKANDPILPSPTDIPSSCLPTISTIIPEGGIAAPGPTNTGSPEYCNKWHVVVTGDTCAAVEAKYKISHTSFRQWNLNVNEACTNLKLTMAYCVRVWVEPVESPEPTPAPTPSTSLKSSASRTSTSAGPPGPTQSGTSATCTKWHLEKQGESFENRRSRGC
jgi:hypothetical protein